jgi:hypothetical protein
METLFFLVNSDDLVTLYPNLLILCGNSLILRDNLSA